MRPIWKTEESPRWIATLESRKLRQQQLQKAVQEQYWWGNGVCPSLDDDVGWHSAAPVDGDIRRRRALGVPGEDVDLNVLRKGGGRGGNQGMGHGYVERGCRSWRGDNIYRFTIDAADVVGAEEVVYQQRNISRSAGSGGGADIEKFARFTGTREEGKDASWRRLPQWLTA